MHIAEHLRHISTQLEQSQKEQVVYNDRMSLFFHRAIFIGMPLLFIGLLAVMDYGQFS